MKEGRRVGRKEGKGGEGREIGFIVSKYEFE
jgi:hypothetical protein